MGDDADDGLAPPPDDDENDGILATPEDETPDDPADEDTAGDAGVDPPPAGGPAGGWFGATAPPDAMPPPPPPTPHRRRGMAIVLAVLAVLVGSTVAVVLALSGSSGNTPLAAPSATAAPSPSLVPPAGLVASPEPFAVTLSWSQPSGGSPIDAYVIYRNDTLVDQVEAGTTSYTDDAVDPGRRYRYRLQAKAGSLSTDYVSVVVRTPKPRLRDARLAGTFNVTFTFLSSSGFTSTSGKFTAGWKFKPKCKTGPCDVTWSDITAKSLKATLKRKGAKYTGNDSGTFFATCGSTLVTSDLTIEFEVKRAKGLDREWRAIRDIGQF